jgi:hypothetical protein
VTDRNWIPFATAVVILNRDGPEPLERALMTGDVGSRGVRHLDDRSIAEGFGQAVEIDPVQWSTLRFNPEKQSLDHASNRRNPSEFLHVRISRGDVERMARAAEPMAGSNDQKRHAVDSAIKRIGLPVLMGMKQKEREAKIVDFVKEDNGITVTGRYVRDRVKAANEEIF